MENLGWIKLHRAMNEWGWKTDPNVTVLWVHLLLNANYEDGIFLGHIIKQGSLATGLISLAEKTGLSIQQVRTALNKLKSTNEITIKTTTKFSIISITNWNNYQDDNRHSNKPITNEQQTSNKPITTIKEDNKLRSKEDKNSVIRPADVSDQVWSDFIAHRKSKKGTVTETVINRYRNEAAKIKWTLEQAIIESCAQNWQGFKAEWVKNNLTKNVGVTQNGKFTQNRVAAIQRTKPVTAAEFDALCNPDLS